MFTRFSTFIAPSSGTLNAQNSAKSPIADNEHTSMYSPLPPPGEFYRVQHVYRTLSGGSDVLNAQNPAKSPIDDNVQKNAPCFYGAIFLDFCSSFAYNVYRNRQPLVCLKGHNFIIFTKMTIAIFGRVQRSFFLCL